jgi:hypothetical protein
MAGARLSSRFSFLSPLSWTTASQPKFSVLETYSPVGGDASTRTWKNG